ncbi:MAG TPA: hypothetical protein VFB90_04945 [Dehalococcoidia bacterium]|nr:hypothetical protein [Dehalococcoidia bacterium]
MITATRETKSSPVELRFDGIAVQSPAYDIFAGARNWRSGVATARKADPFLSRHWLNQPGPRTQERLTIPAFAPRERELAGVAA